MIFDYQTSRSGSHVRNFLGNWQGHLLVDDYGGYKALFDDKRTTTPCIELGCWAYVRRKFFDLHQANSSPMALEALKRIALLYNIEQHGQHLDQTARCQLRQQHSLPTLESLDRCY